MCGVKFPVLVELGKLFKLDSSHPWYERLLREEESARSGLRGLWVERLSIGKHAWLAERFEP